MSHRTSANVAFLCEPRGHITLASLGDWAGCCHCSLFKLCDLTQKGVTVLSSP